MKNFWMNMIAGIGQIVCFTVICLMKDKEGMTEWVWWCFYGVLAFAEMYYAGLEDGKKNK